MSEEPMKSLEGHLTALTEWDGPEPEVWRRALDDAPANATPERSLLARIASTPISRPRLAVAATLCLCTAVVAVLMLMQANERAQMTASPRTVVDLMGPVLLHDAATHNDRQLAFINDNFSKYSDASVGAMTLTPGSGAGGRTNGTDHDLPQAANAGGLDSAERHVVRKATIELVAADVRAAFLRAQHLVSAAEGEFVEASSLSGADDSAQANLTLRVAVHRLPQVLNELRDLGEVRAETATGDDVTSRIVDLEARLRNEQRIESELLELVEKRNDAPLKEILELRAELSRVRTGIEQLAGQRAHMSRLVALASVLVIIRPEVVETKEEPEEGELGPHFGESIAEAWTSGLRILSDSLAWVVQTLVGGLVWWLLLMVLALIVRRAWLRSPALLST